ncbi:MAG: hypothetical protein O3A21_09065 [Proteobacteria bacterium]|nr:hypothetical protein [Pseudomonadota bacterium]
MKRLNLLVLAGLLTAIAAAIFLYKVVFLAFPLIPDSKAICGQLRHG